MLIIKDLQESYKIIKACHFCDAMLQSAEHKWVGVKISL